MIQRRQKASSLYTWLIVTVVLLAASVFYFAKNNGISASKQEATAKQTPTAIQSQTSTPEMNLALAQVPAHKTVEAKILMYHHIGPLPADADDIRKGLTVSSENFEAQIKFLVDNKYDIVTLKKLYKLIAKGEETSKTVVLTFDDGYDDNYDVAWPIMEKYKVNGTFFIITGEIGKSEYMTGSGLSALFTGGNELGSHTLTHPSLDQLSGAKLKNEIVASKQWLEKLTGEPIYSFCYPAGKFSPEAEKDLEDAGYKIAVTTQAGKPFSSDKIFEVPRYRMNPTTRLEALFK